MLEEKIRSHLLTDEKLTALLTTYAGQPAIFLQQAPGDTDEKWQKGPQYNRVIFGLDRAGDPSRELSGQMWADIYCHGDTFPEDIAPILAAALDNRFFSEDGDTIALAWKNTNGFQQTIGDVLINGATLTFEVLGFPLQTTTTPDPIEAINRWTKERMEAAVVIGLDTPPDTWTPVDHPTIYWRVSKIGNSRIADTYQVSWHDADLRGHILIDDINLALTLCKAMGDDLMRDKRGRIIMADKSPLMLNTVNVMAEADPLSQGQLSVNGTYGVLRHYPPVEILQHAYVSPKD